MFIGWNEKITFIVIFKKLETSSKLLFRQFNKKNLMATIVEKFGFSYQKLNISKEKS